MKNRFNWIVVKDKKQYLWLLSVPLCILKFFAYDLRHPHTWVSDLMITVIILNVCIYFFIRMNSYSALMNPDHPKPDHRP